MQFNKCPICGAYLDPGEKCDCEEDRKLPDANQNSLMRDDTLPYSKNTSDQGQSREEKSHDVV